MLQRGWTADTNGFSRDAGCYRLVVRESSGTVQYMVLLSPDGAGRTPFMMLESGSEPDFETAVAAAERVLARMAHAPAGSSQDATTAKV